MEDNRGVLRGLCQNSTKCKCKGFQFDSTQASVSKLCECGCPPGKHANLKQGTSTVDQMKDSMANMSLGENASALTTCLLCRDEAYFDINTGVEYKYCEHHLNNHLGSTTNPTHPVPSAADIQLAPNIPLGGTASQATPCYVAASASPSSCAIQECNRPRHVDDDGTVHECCGYTHAMEMIRRKNVKMMKQSVVKGVTHCFLPDCDRLTWPFMNYCSKTHAKEGKQKGLAPPSQTGISLSASKNSSLCGFPGCSNSKYVENGRSYDFCGKRHRDEAKKRGLKIEKVPSGPKTKTNEMCILEGCYEKKFVDKKTVHDYCSKAHAEKAKSSNDQTVSKDDDSLCIIPECSRPKYQDSDCCGKDHAQEAKSRGIQPILTSRSEVEKFLQQFSTKLTVVDLEENDHAKRGGVLYNKFKDARDKLPQQDQKTCLAFHGTDKSNIQSICANGYDPAKRSGQAYGPGEYFATTPSTPLVYCKGGKKLLLNELLLGKEGTHHTTSGDIVVMKHPEHDLPRFTITFQ